MRFHPFSLAIPIVSTVLVGGCSQSPPPQQPGGVAMAQPVDGQSAAWRVATAQCRHASACRDIGGNRNYASMDACMSKNRGEAQDNLRASNCPHGVDSARLDSCIASIDAESCSGIGSGLNRFMACRTSEICP